MVVLLREQSVSDCRHLSHVGAALFSAGVSLLIATNTDCISQTCHVEGCRQLGSYAVVDAKSPYHSLTPVGQFSMSSIKRDVKKKVLPRPEAEKIFVSRSSPLSVSAPPISVEGFCSGLSALPVGFIFRW